MHVDEAHDALRRQLRDEEGSFGGGDEPRESRANLGDVDRITERAREGGDAREVALPHRPHLGPSHDQKRSLSAPPPLSFQSPMPWRRRYPRTCARSMAARRPISLTLPLHSA